MKKSHVNFERSYAENGPRDYKLYFRYLCRTILRPNSWQMQSNGTFNSYCSNRLTPINSSLLVTISISFGIHIRYLTIIITTKIFINFTIVKEQNDIYRGGPIFIFFCFSLEIQFIHNLPFGFCCCSLQFEAFVNSKEWKNEDVDIWTLEKVQLIEFEQNITFIAGSPAELSARLYSYFWISAEARRLGKWSNEGQQTAQGRSNHEETLVHTLWRTLLEKRMHVQVI